MANPTTAAVNPPTEHRPVLLWRPDSDESRVEPGLDQAARFLKVPADAVVAAIESGDLLEGWFVDWQAVNLSSDVRG